MRLEKKNFSENEDLLNNRAEFDKKKELKDHFSQIGYFGMRTVCLREGNYSILVTKIYYQLKVEGAHHHVTYKIV